MGYYSSMCEPLRVWNRLEPRTRQQDFSRPLRAEISDPLWMLARQWQFGEFHGEDTGSAIFARLAIRSSKINAIGNAQGQFTPYQDSYPLEAWVESQKIPDDWQLRIQLGRQWLRILDHYGRAYNDAGGTPAYDATVWKQTFLQRFGITPPEVTGDSPIDQVLRARLNANSRLKQQLSAVDSRMVDGLALLDALPDGSIVWSALPASLYSGVDSAHRDFLLESLCELRAFYQRHWSSALGSEKSWLEEQLEYRFAAKLANPEGGELNLSVEEFHGGNIDWFSFDLATSAAAVQEEEVDSRVLTVIPSPAEFPGQPQARYWEFEDGAVDLGNLRADSTDLARILVTEYALVYGNNWFVIPCPQAVGSIAEIEGIVVEDVFGQRTFVQSATRNAASDWTRWDLFSLSGSSRSSARIEGSHLLIPPAICHSLDAEPQESVRLVRDEMSNTVWGIEARVPDGIGGSYDGYDNARRFSALLQQSEPAAEVLEPLAGAELSYQLANTVPENWIPFLPVHKPGEDREVRLQRASMPRFFQQSVRPVRPLTPLLRPGLLDNDQQSTPYFIHEEEISRAGTRVDGGFRRARWYDGTTFVWYAYRKRSGRGEGNSGLRFDRLEEIRPQKG